MASTAVQAANINTVASGNWTTTGTWAAGLVPTTLDQARLKHDVTLNSSVSTHGGVFENRATPAGSKVVFVVDRGLRPRLFMFCPFGTGDQTWDDGFGYYLQSYYDGGADKTYV